MLLLANLGMKIEIFTDLDNYNIHCFYDNLPLDIDLKKHHNDLVSEIVLLLIDIVCSFSKFGCMMSSVAFGLQAVKVGFRNFNGWAS